MKPFLASLLLCVAFFSSSLPGLAESSGLIPADVLEQLGADGWVEVAPGVLQRSLEPGRVETLGVGAEGQRFRLAELKKHLAFLRAEYQRHPSADLRKAIRAQRAEVLRAQAGLKAAAKDKLTPSFEKIFASGTNCGANYNGTADAFAKSPGAGVTANVFFRSDCGDEGEVYVTTIARASSADGTISTMSRSDPTTAPNTPRFGSDITASASVSVNGVKDCFSHGYASVTSYDPIITYAVDDTNNSCVSVPNPGEVLINEFRFRGPNGTNDEFVELYNNTSSTVYVGVADGSSGWALVGSDGVTRFVVPNGTVLQPRGRYLATNVTYSLGGYATGNIGYSADIANGAGIALFRTANPLNFNLANRLDAVGYSTVDSLYREGAGLPTGGAETTTDLNYSFYRNLAGGLPADSNDNAVDFFGVDTTGATLGTGQRLGAPGPENLSSPVERNAEIATSFIDPAVCTTCAPNRVRDTTPTTENPYGTLTIRRRYTNNTGRTITRLRFRVVNVTTLPVPAGTADVRVRTSADSFVTLTNGTTITVKGTTLETPPSQPLGGGWNSSIAVSGGLAPGASVDVQFVLGLIQTGTFRFYINAEAD
jgi:hypothetical protein